MLASAAMLLFLLPLQTHFSWIEGAGDGTRIIVDTHVTCEGKPDFRLKIPLGMPIRTIQERKVGEDTWYIGYPAMAPNSPCWVYAPSTAVWHKADPDALRLAVIDHVLARRNAGLEDFVEVETFLFDSDPRWMSKSGRDQISGLLRFRWLQMLSRVLQMDQFNSRTDEPLVRSWMLNHGDLFEYFGPSGTWYVPELHFWHVFDSNKTAAWADELAWFVATLPVHTDECETTCTLSYLVGERFLQYWSRLPTGSRVGDALIEANKVLQVAITLRCESKEDLQLVKDIRASLSMVLHPAKQLVLKSLAAIEQSCPK